MSFRSAPGLHSLGLTAVILTSGALAGCIEERGVDGATGGAGLSTGGAPTNVGGAPGGGASGSGGVAANSAGGTNSLADGGSTATGGTAATGGAGNGGSTSAGGAETGGAPAGGSGGDGTGGSPGGNGGENASGGAAHGTGGTASLCPEVPALTGGTSYCSNKKGSAGGRYSFEIWASGTGSGCMTVYNVDATFGATWTDREDFLARVGLDFDQTKTHQQIGTISADFAETKTDDGGLTYVGVYGWTVNPLREYYILDDWGDTKPAGVASDGTPRDSVGTIVVDGETYDVWKKTRENKPAITGDNMTFDQYFSIRRTARQCGHISVSEHFSQWEALGLPLGNLYEAKLLLEAQNNSGSIEFTTATVAVE